MDKAIRMGNWKLFWNDEKDWLFDLSEDIGESMDQAVDEPETVMQLKQQLTSAKTNKKN